jgi:TfoX/Sxy family transcriptional regulator of competence genes
MFGYPGAFVHGNLVCCLFQDSVVVRLGKEGVARAMAEEQATPFTPMPGRTMRDYVAIPARDAQDEKPLSEWLRRALDFTLTLPRKPPRPPAKRAPRARTNRSR